MITKINIWFNVIHLSYFLLRVLSEPGANHSSQHPVFCSLTIPLSPNLSIHINPLERLHFLSLCRSFKISVTFCKPPFLIMCRRNAKCFRCSQILSILIDPFVDPTVSLRVPSISVKTSSSLQEKGHRCKIAAVQSLLTF